MSVISSASSNTSKKKAFVLKLRLVGESGTTQIRRVRIPLIQVDDQVSYQALVELAISYAFPGSPVVAGDHDVIMTYYDVDNDCITIASTEELVDAIEQFSVLQNPVLRITTDVKNKERPAQSQFTILSSRAAFSTSATSNSNTPEDEDPTTRPSLPLNGRTKQLQNLVESFVSILTTAVVALQNQVAEVNPNITATDTQPDVATSTAAQISDAEESETAEKLAKEAASNIEMNRVDTAPTHEDAVKTGEEQAPEERQFIHGRHTCDGCLCTPIIGIRYHSTNLPDYDLCAKCRGNYKGTEIKFEPAKLDRDDPFQERWHRKRARFAQRGGACRPNGPGSCGPRHSPRSGPPFRGPNGRRRGRHFGRQEGGMDAALKEAIRRSLQDVKDETVPEPSAPTKAPVLVAGAPIEAPVLIADAKEVAPFTGGSSAEMTDVTESAFSSAEATPVQDDAAGEIVEEANNPTNGTVKDTSFSSDAIGHGDAAERLGHTLDECAEAISAMVFELDREQEIATVESNTDDEVTAVEFDTDDEVTAVEFDTDDEVTAVEFDTVDQVVPVEFDTDEDELPALVETISVQEAIVGEKIVDGEEVNEGVDEDEDKQSESGEEEWEVVGEDHQIAGDAMIARAAQLIGSALFQSDLRSSEGGSTLTNSGIFGERSECLSVPSSVPSMSSEIPCAVLDRWALQLSQLHELGFHDDKKTAEILERLTAANIGVDSDDEVSVTQVVNALLKRE